MRKHVNASIATHSAFSTLKESLDDLMESKELLYQFCLRNIRIRYKQAVMGIGWAILMPILIVAAGLVIRFATATLSGKPLESDVVATMTVKSLPWAFFAGALGFAVTSLTVNGSLITKIHFPREVLPIASILAQVVDTSIGAVFICLALPFLGVSPHWSQLWVPVLILLLFLFTCAAGLILAVANLFFRDVKYLVQVLITYGIFFTPVLFEPVTLGATGAELIMLNPLAPIVEGFRLAVVDGHNLALPLVTHELGPPTLIWSPWYLALSAVWATVGLLISIIVFHRAQYRFAELA